MKLKNVLESIMQRYLNPLEDSIKGILSPLGDVSVNAAENEGNERVFGSVTFREEVLPDEGKIESLLKQVKGPNGEDLDIQIDHSQTWHEKESEDDRIVWPRVKFTAKKGVYTEN
tara:strand:+ start:191 stop:535 length:345 start_codon:yes stop_codon:yes gene_type:complete